MSTADSQTPEGVATSPLTEAAVARSVLVEAPSGERPRGEAVRKPKTIARLSDWQYIERSMHRLLAAWGRHFCEWSDIVACHRHVWEQAECVRRLRERLGQFPGSAQHLDAPVSVRLEGLVNAVLLAPLFQDAVDGIYGILLPALCRSYQLYGATAHAIHDAPTVAALHEIIALKEGMRLWRADFRRRFPHVTDPAYAAGIQHELKTCGDLLEAVPVEPGDHAAPAGLNTSFKLPAHSGRPAGSRVAWDIKPYLARDFSTSVEARRLFWCYGYMLEMNLAIDQLKWVWASHEMPWEFQADISRHLWDESRHGNSGMSRLLDFGIGIADVGFPSHGDQLSQAADAGSMQPISASGEAQAMTSSELYEAVYFIGMVAETGHFGVKRQAYDDFCAGGDLESAEMMLFDIIDETTHVQYAHKWLPALAEHAHIDSSNYQDRGARDRDKAQANHLQSLEDYRALPNDLSDPRFAQYQKLLAIMREKQPLANASTCPPRDPLPM